MYTTEEARAIGDKIGLDWNKVDIKQFKMGLQVESEHGSKYGQFTNITNDDPLITGRIAYAHLLEIPDYYDRLKKMEAEAKA